MIPRLAGRQRAGLLLGFARTLRVHIAVRDPCGQPFGPSLDTRCHAAEVVEVDTLRHESRRPVRDGRLDALIGHAP